TSSSPGRNGLPTDTDVETPKFHAAPTLGERQLYGARANRAFRPKTTTPTAPPSIEWSDRQSLLPKHETIRRHLISRCSADLKSIDHAEPLQDHRFPNPWLNRCLRWQCAPHRAPPKPLLPLSIPSGRDAADHAG